jgi:hypothetical protein
METRLCVACGSFFRKASETLRESKKSTPPRAGEVYCKEKHHGDLSSLREAAENGCPLCILFNGQLQHQIDHDPKAHRLEEFQNISMTIKLSGSSESGSKSAWTLLLHIWATGRSIYNGIILDDLRIELYPSTISMSSAMNYFFFY